MMRSFKLRNMNVKYVFLVITSTRDYREREYIEMGTRFVYIGTVFLCDKNKVNTLIFYAIAR